MLGSGAAGGGACGGQRKPSMMYLQDEVVSGLPEVAAN